MERVVQFETKRRTSPGFDMLASYSLEIEEIRKKASTGVAWLSSVRAVRCSLKWGNERNPHPMLHDHWKQRTHFELRKEGQMSSQHGLYTLGNTHTTMAKNNEQQARECKRISQISPQFRSESATRLREAGIGSNRRSANCGEYVLGSCTHRPSRQQSR